MALNEKQQRGLRVKAFRALVDITQVEMALLLNMSQSNYNMIERGVNELIPENLHILGMKFGYSANYHLFGIGTIIDDRIKAAAKLHH